MLKILVKQRFAHAAFGLMAKNPTSSSCVGQVLIDFLITHYFNTRIRFWILCCGGQSVNKHWQDSVDFVKCKALFHPLFITTL